MTPTKPELNPLNLGSVANGAAIELFEKAMQKVAANIADTSTDATAGREITLKFKIKPDDERKTLYVTTTSSVKLAPIAEHTSKSYLGKDTAGNTHIFDRDPRQDVLFEAPEPENTLLHFGQK